MRFTTLYNLVLYLLIAITSPFWLAWMALVPKVRAGFREKLGGYAPVFLQRLATLPREKRIWLHAVSVGELNAARPLIELLTKLGYPVVISNTTATGYTLAQTTFPHLPNFYFPFDLPGPVKKAFRTIQPALVVILETEIWPNLLVQARYHQVPVFLANGRLSSKSYQGYRRFKWLFQWVLNHFSLLMMQSQADAKRMLNLGVRPEQVLVCGNLKFDLAPVTQTPQKALLEKLFNFPRHAQVLVFASTHKGEDEIFMRIFEDLRLDFPDLRAILAPRHPERFNQVATMLKGRGTRFVQRSQLSEANANTQDTPVILLDSIGELNTAYTLGTVACMGGSFIEWGGHNPLEPINAEIPVVFGPHMENFREIASRILEAHAGFQVNTPQEAEQQIRELLTRPEYYDHIVRNGRKLMAENRGVAQTIANRIQEILGQTVSL